MQIKKKFIKNDAIDGTKLLLLNNQSVRSLDSSGNPVELMKYDSLNDLRFLTLPKSSIAPTHPEHLTTKEYVDYQVNMAYYWAIAL